MSQSDYLNRKRVATVLLDNKLPPILAQRDFLQYKQYSLENSITNTKLTFHKLPMVNRPIIFGMETTVCGTSASCDSCGGFLVCKNTNQRPNRRPVSAQRIQPIPRAIYNKKQFYDICHCIPIQYVPV